MKIKFFEVTELTLTLNGGSYTHTCYNDEEYNIVIISENAGYCDLQFQDGATAFMVPRSSFELVGFTGNLKYNRLAYVPKLDTLPLP